MALIKCMECGAEVSSEAKTCPKCGKGVAPKRRGCGSAIAVLLLGGAAISTLSSINSSDIQNNTAPGNSPSGFNDHSVPNEPEPKLPGSQWSYLQGADPMDKGMIYQAWVSSSNTVSFDFPYSGEQNAKLTLRTHPRYGKDLIFSIEKGQILCPSYEDCIVLVRFDDEQAVKYNAVGADDNSSETIFLRNYGSFVGKMRKAKRVRIAANIFHEGAPVFEFDVSDFDQNKYKPKPASKKASGGS